MALRRVIYRSQVARSVRFADAEAVAQTAAPRNREVGITGLLLYTPSHFIQVLEGEAEAVAATLARISKDPRHTSVCVLLDEAATRREFGEWAMTARFHPEPRSSLETLDATRALTLLREARDEPSAP